MLPAQISAMPAYITVSVWPRLDRPAVRAKGTVRPSAKPSVKSARKREREGRAPPSQEDDTEPQEAACRCAGWRRRRPSEESWTSERGRSSVELEGEVEKEVPKVSRPSGE